MSALYYGYILCSLKDIHEGIFDMNEFKGGRRNNVENGIETVWNKKKFKLKIKIFNF